MPSFWNWKTARIQSKISGGERRQRKLRWEIFAIEDRILAGRDAPFEATRSKLTASITRAELFTILRKPSPRELY